MAACVALFAISGCATTSSPQASASQPVPPSPTSSSPSPSPQPPGLLGPWTRLARVKAFADFVPTGLVAFHGDLVAVGYQPGDVRSGGGSLRAAIWISSDGRTWSPVTDLPSGRGDQIQAVTAGGPGLVAVGSGAWVSADGHHWRRTLDLRPGQGVVRSGGYLSVLATFGHQLVAVGQTDGPIVLAASFPHWQPAVLTSPDGSAWRELDASRATFLMGDPPTAMVVFGGRLILANNSGIWSSPDGASWTSEATGLNSGLNSVLSQIIVGAPGLVAIGARDLDRSATSCGCHVARPAFLTSPDGTHWAASRAVAEVDNTGAWNAVAVPGGYVAVGQGPTGPGVWTSPDGAVWTPSLDPALNGVGGPSMRHVVQFGAELVAIADYPLSGASQRVDVWIAPLGGT